MDFAAIGNLAAKSDTAARPVVKGRVLQYDSDFGCYECAHLEDSITQNFRLLKKHVLVKKALAGAEHVNTHLTLGLKGGRDQIATVKPYQAQRKGVNLEVKARVLELRTMLANHRIDEVTPIANLYTEADDTLTAYQLADIENSVIGSGDKDLWMVDGLHCDMKTGRIWRVDGYGKTEYKEVGNMKPKLIGEGTSWFWHQLIMGDGADNIPGLPKLSGRLANIYLPLKTHNPKRGPVACGEAKAVAMLKGVTTDKEAMSRVLEAYIGHYNHGGTAIEMLVEQAFLLWMRRTPAIDDCVKFLNEIGLKCSFSTAQLTALRKYKQLCLIQKAQGDF